MPSFSVYWDGERYVARFRAGRKDTRRRIPSRVWTTFGLREPDAESAKHERAALRWAAEIAPTVTPPRQRREEMTLREVYALMVRENPRRVAELTLKKWACDWANLEPFFGDLVPSEVDDASATMYRNVRESDPRAPRSRTIANELEFLMQIVRFAARWKRVTGTEAISAVELPALEDQESQQVALTKDEVRALLLTQHWNEERNRQILVVGISTMLRRRNLFGLRWEWIEGDWLTVPAGEMKGRSKRAHEMPLAEVALESLPRPRRSAGWVWPNPGTGKPYTWVHDNFRRWADAAKVRQFSPHDLRTTGNSWLAREGVDDFTRAALMGHSRTQSTTLRRSGSVTDKYTKVYRTHLRETVGIFDSIFREMWRD